MKKEDIEKYEYCKRYKAELQKWAKSLPFKIQYHGCGSGVPVIEHTLEEVHRQMFELVDNAMREAERKVESIIEKT